MRTLGAVQTATPLRSTSTTIRKHTRVSSTSYIACHQGLTFATLDPNLTMWRSGVPGGAGYSWPRNELVSSFCPFCTVSDLRSRSRSTLEVVDVIWTYSLSTLPISFLLAFYGLIFIDFLPSSLPCCESKNICCLTNPHDLGTRRLFGGTMDSSFHVSRHCPSLYPLTHHHHTRHIIHGSSCTL